MPLPADATEFVDAPTIDCDALGWVAFKLVLLGDHWVKSSSTISVVSVASCGVVANGSLYACMVVCLILRVFVFFLICCFFFLVNGKENENSKKKKKFLCKKMQIMQDQVNIFMVGYTICLYCEKRETNTKSHLNRT